MILMSLAIFGVLWVLRRRMRFAGGLFALYIFFNGLERFWIEKIRVNNVLEFAGIRATQAEFISVGFMLFGLAFMAFLWQRSRNRTV